MKVLQVMSGAERGGAEEFFVRLTAAFSQTSLSQKVVIRNYRQRADELVASGVETKTLPFRRWFDLRTQLTLKKIIEEWKEVNVVNLSMPLSITIKFKHSNLLAS